MSIVRIVRAADLSVHHWEEVQMERHLWEFNGSDEQYSTLNSHEFEQF